MSKVLLPGEFEHLLDGARELIPKRSNRRDVLAIILMYDLALRVHEACGLTRMSFSPDLTIVQVSGKGSRWHSGKKMCQLPVSTRLQEELKGFGITGPYDPILQTGSGRAVAPQHYRRLLAWLGPAAIGRHVYPHMLRHSRITDLGIDAGKPLPAVQAFARHDSLATTEQYLHLRENWMDDLRDAL